MWGIFLIGKGKTPQPPKRPSEHPFFLHCSEVGEKVPTYHLSGGKSPQRWGKKSPEVGEKVPTAYYIIVTDFFRLLQTCNPPQGSKRKKPLGSSCSNPEKRERVPLALHPFQDYGVSLFIILKESGDPLWVD